MVVNTKFIVGATTYQNTNLISVKSSINQNNTTSSYIIELANRDGAYANTFTIGTDITIYAQQTTNPPNNKLLVGRIEHLDFDSQPNHEVLRISGRDYTAALMDSTIEPEVYNNTEVSAIITDLVSKYGPGITTTNVQVTSTVVPRIVYLQSNLFDAIKDLADEAGYYFFVDVNKDLNFIPQGQTSSNQTLDNTNVTKATITQTTDQLANKIYVYGKRILTGQRDFFTANGGSVFTLSYKPENPTVTLSGTMVLSGGIYNQNISSSNPYQYLVNYDSKQIIFASGTVAGNNVPGSGGSFLVEGFRVNPIAKLGQNDASIALYGQRNKVIIDDQIQDPVTAVNTLTRQLNLFSLPPLEGNVEIYGIIFLTAGQLVTVNLPNENISNQIYTILEANYEFTPETQQTEKVLKVKVSTKRRDFLDTMKQVILDLKKLQAAQINTQSIFTRLQFSNGSAGFSDVLWYVKTRTIGNSFILGHPINGVLGSPQIAINGSQVFLGDFRSALSIVVSGTGLGA